MGRAAVAGIPSRTASVYIAPGVVMSHQTGELVSELEDGPRHRCRYTQQNPTTQRLLSPLYRRREGALGLRLATRPPHSPIQRADIFVLVTKLIETEALWLGYL